MDDSSHPLVERLRAGDRSAIGALIERHLPGLRAFVRLHGGRALREQESCSDLVQSACREVIEGLDQFEYRGEAAFRHWLYKAAEHKLMDRARYYGRQKRDAGRNVRLDDSQGSQDAGVLRCYATLCSPSGEAIARERADQIEQAIDRLPPAYREVLLLSRSVGLSNDEIAREIGQDSAYTRVLLSRSLAKLSTLLGDPVG